MKRECAWVTNDGPTCLWVDTCAASRQYNCEVNGNARALEDVVC
jgi:hypothetical protein